MIYNKKCIEDYDIKDKKVIIRVDFNVPIENGYIEDDNRIKESLITIKYAIKKGAKVILLSHLGRIKEEADLQTNSLSIVAIRLSELLYKQVIFIDKTRGLEVEEAINNMKPGDIVLLENTRFEDLNGNLESSNNETLAKYWASLGDIFINDAFAVSHRAHASNYGIASYLPSGIGFLVKKELDMMVPILENPTKPYFAVLGGAKVKDKIGLINHLALTCDYILVGGAMAFTFLKAKGYNVGKSMVDDSSIPLVKDILAKYGKKIVLPVDIVTGVSLTKGEDVKIKNAFELDFDDVGLDIGPKTVELFKKGILLSKTIISNGPMGLFEKEEFSKGTNEILAAMIGDRKVIIGGGDTASAVINMGYKDKYTHVSTGGGATLELFAGNKLPGIEIINEK